MDLLQNMNPGEKLVQDADGLCAQRNIPDGWVSVWNVFYVSVTTRQSSSSVSEISF